MTDQHEQHPPLTVTSELPGDAIAESPMPPPFRCEVSSERDRAFIRAVGELDVATVPIFKDALAALRDAGFRKWTIDLSRLEFMDSSGMRCILESHAEAARAGCSIAVISGPPAVQRIFELTETRAHLPFVDAGASPPPD